MLCSRVSSSLGYHGTRRVPSTAVDEREFEPSVVAPFYDKGEVVTSSKTALVAVMDAIILAESGQCEIVTSSKSAIVAAMDAMILGESDCIPCTSQIVVL